MSVIQESESISDRTKVRTRKASIAGHQTTAIKAQDWSYFKSKSHLKKNKTESIRAQRTRGKKNPTKQTTTKRSKSTQDIHKTCSAPEHSKLKLERVNFLIFWILNEKWRCKPCNSGGMLISRITAQEEYRDFPGKVPNWKPSVSFLNIHLKKTPTILHKKNTVDTKTEKEDILQCFKALHMV